MLARTTTLTALIKDDAVSYVLIHDQNLAILGFLTGMAGETLSSSIASASLANVQQQHL